MPQKQAQGNGCVASFIGPILISRPLGAGEACRWPDLRMTALMLLPLDARRRASYIDNLVLGIQPGADLGRRINRLTFKKIREDSHRHFQAIVVALPTLI